MQAQLTGPSHSSPPLQQGPTAKASEPRGIGKGRLPRCQHDPKPNSNLLPSPGPAEAKHVPFTAAKAEKGAGKEGALPSAPGREAAAAQP